MSEAQPNKPIGAILWQDLTVPNADVVRDFYCSVVGWKWEKHPDCEDFTIQDDQGNTVAGICYAEGANAGLPPYWMLYVSVESVSDSIARSTLLGGKVVHGPRTIGGKSFCVIQDPAGAFLGLFER